MRNHNHRAMIDWHRMYILYTIYRSTLYKLLPIGVRAREASALMVRNWTLFETNSLRNGADDGAMRFQNINTIYTIIFMDYQVREVQFQIALTPLTWDFGFTLSKRCAETLILIDRLLLQCVEFYARNSKRLMIKQAYVFF